MCDSREQRIQIRLSAVTRVFAMRNVNTPTCNVSMHAKKVASPALFGWAVINKDLGANYMDIAVFSRRIGGDQ
jgi:hypothetical protein